MLRAVSPIWCVLSVVGPASTQVSWSRLGPAHPPARVGGSLAFDANRARTVLFGGQEQSLLSDQTWEWDGALWVQRTPPVSPPPRAYGALAYDSARGRAVLFGGNDYQIATPALGDTWEWDGTVWLQPAPATSPPPRTGHAMVYQPGSGRVLLFGGGSRGGGPFADTWEWDGTSWMQRFPTSSPTPRSGHAMAYDAASGRVVLFGGSASSTQVLGDTWEWDGTTWTPASPAVSPPARSGHALAYDPTGRLVLFGGYSGSLGFGDTWTWDGVLWIQATPPLAPPALAGHSLSFDAPRRRVVLFGGNDAAGSFRAQTWEWAGASWQLVVDPIGAPGAAWHALADDPVRGRVVLFGGVDRASAGTWLWDGSRWALHPAASPSLRTAPAMTFDTWRSRVLLFSGHTGALPPPADTWEWDGTVWNQQQPASSPPGRLDHVLAFDRRRGRAVLFGGWQSSGSSRFDDTWEWDGSQWLQMQPATRPIARMRSAAAFDAARGVVVMFGGSAPNGSVADTWQWDGTNWVQARPAHSPSARSGHAMAYDEARARVVMFGGQGGLAPLADTWEWDGSDWLQRTPTVAPSARSSHAMAYDSTRGQILVFGGLRSRGMEAELLDDTWRYATDFPARFASYGTGCAGTAGVPELLPQAGSSPWLGDRFTLQVQRLPVATQVALLLGASRSSWNGVPLPLALDPLGMTGCALLARPTLLLPGVMQAGIATVTLGIPADTALAGQPFFTQALVLDAQANAGGAVVSAGGEATVGWR